MKEILSTIFISNYSTFFYAYSQDLTWKGLDQQQINDDK